jgi:hypothetical protein
MHLRWLLLTAGVLAASSALAQKGPPATAGQTRLTLIRLCAMPTDWNAAIFVDGEKVAMVPNVAHRTVPISPGEHDIKIKWPSGVYQPDVERRISFEANRTGYVLFESRYKTVFPPNYEPTGKGPGAHWITEYGIGGVRPIEEDRATALIASIDGARRKVRQIVSLPCSNEAARSFGK